MNKKLFIIGTSIGIILVAVIVIILVSVKSKSGTMICTYTNKNTVYSIHTEYQINYKNNVVTKLKTIETIESNDSKMLEEYKVSLEAIYSNYNKLKYYDNNVVIKNNKLTSTTNINYDKLDLEEWTKIDSNNKQLLVDDKVNYEKVKNIYIENGAKCKSA